MIGASYRYQSSNIHILHPCPAHVDSESRQEFPSGTLASSKAVRSAAMNSKRIHSLADGC